MVGEGRAASNNQAKLGPLLHAEKSASRQLIFSSMWGSPDHLGNLSHALSLCPVTLGSPKGQRGNSPSLGRVSLPTTPEPAWDTA